MKRHLDYKLIIPVAIDKEETKRVKIGIAESENAVMVDIGDDFVRCDNSDRIKGKDAVPPQMKIGLVGTTGRHDVHWTEAQQTLVYKAELTQVG